MQHQWKQRLQALRMFGAQTELSAPCVELNANRQAIIEGCEGIVEYSASTVKLNCKSMVLLLQGFDLCLEHLSSTQVCVSGTICTLQFLSV